MEVIDILNKMAKKEKGTFKFWVDATGGYITEEQAIHWRYADGEVDNDHYIDLSEYLLEVYKLTDPVYIIEEKKEEKTDSFPPLDYIKFNFEQSVNDISNTITYGSITAKTDHDTHLLALVMNRVIKEVLDLKDNINDESGGSND